MASGSDTRMFSRGVSSTGARRFNQDSGYYDAQIAIVADGVGGGPHGDVASATTVTLFAGLMNDEIVAQLAGDAALSSGRHHRQELHDDALLRGIIAKINDHIRAMTRADGELAGMATTMTAIVLAGEQMHVAHIGDSRAYLLRDGELIQITRDDSWVQTLLDAGQITAEEAEHHPMRNLLMRSLNGTRGDADYVTIASYPVQKGDRWLLCSDGLSSYVPTEYIYEALAVDDAGTSAEQLLRVGLMTTRDNLTMIVADVLPAEEVDGTAPGVFLGAAYQEPLINSDEWFNAG